MTAEKKRRPGGGGADESQARDEAHDNGTAGEVPPQLVHGIDQVHATAGQHPGRLALAFLLTPAGSIQDDALVLHGADALAVVPVWLLPTLLEKLPTLDTTAVRQTIATWHAEQAGQGGHA